jgi:hypothetical protein
MECLLVCYQDVEDIFLSGSSETPAATAIFHRESQLTRSFEAALDRSSALGLVAL